MSQRDRRQTISSPDLGSLESQNLSIIFDAFWWSDGPPSGQNVVRSLVVGWRRYYPDDRLTLHLRRGRFQPSDLPEGVGIATTRIPLHPLANMLSLRRRGRRTASEIVCQNFGAGSTSTVLIHDLIFARHPEWFTRSECAYMSCMVPLAKRSGTVLSTSISEFQHLSAILNNSVPVHRVGLDVPFGLAEATAEMPPNLFVNAMPTSFYLTVGRLNARKNLHRLLRAAIESKIVQPSAPLVVVGQPSGLTASYADDIISTAVRNRSVIFTGYVNDSNVHWLYKNCAGFACLSLEEGYGLPPIEASHFGAPALLSDIPVFREVARGKTIFCDPYSVSDIAMGFRKLADIKRQARTCNDVTRGSLWKDVVKLTRAALVERGSQP